jgi:hypothetical protein
MPNCLQVVLAQELHNVLIGECKIWLADMFNLIDTTPYMNCKYGRVSEGVVSVLAAVSTPLDRSSMPKNRFVRFLILGDNGAVIVKNLTMQLLLLYL